MTIVITNQFHIANTTGASIALPMASAASVGDSIIVGLIEDNTTGLLGSLTDDAANVYTLLAQASPNNANANGRAGLWACHNCKALLVGQNITYTKNSNVAVNMAAGTITGGPFLTDKNPAPTTGSSTTPSIVSGVLTNADEAVFALIGLGTGATGDTFTQVAGFAVPFDNFTKSGGGISLKGGSDVVSSTASVTYNPTITSRTWCALLATFKVAAIVTQKQIPSVSPELISLVKASAKNPSITESEIVSIASRLSRVIAPTLYVTQNISMLRRMSKILGITVSESVQLSRLASRLNTVKSSQLVTVPRSFNKVIII